ncbi:hypothetical protein [Providencia rettgeri]|uniref:hypothetical protein n=1 Tax=Providencia rettgeri TaxID=587 RepID=UPI0012BD6689|nr:hypothetical protein [Providencia rettgeri]
MRNTLASRHQRNNRTVNEVEVNTMSNSMAMLLIYHGLPRSSGKKPCHLVPEYLR